MPEISLGDIARSFGHLLQRHHSVSGLEMSVLVANHYDILTGDARTKACFEALQGPYAEARIWKDSHGDLHIKTGDGRNRHFTEVH